MGPIPSHRQPADRQAETEPTDQTDPIGAIRSLVGAGETIETIIESNGDPLVRESASGAETFDSKPSDRAMGVLTDRRIVLDGGTEDDPVVSIPYRDVRAVDLDDPRGPATFSVTVEAATTWRLGVAPSAASAAKYGHRLVEKAIDCFEQIDEATRVVRTARADLVEPIDDGDWATTRERYERMRSTVDHAQVGVENSPFDGVEAFCSSLDRADATLEAAAVEATLRRVEKLRTVGRQWLDDGDIERGAQAIETARESLADIAERTDDYDLAVGADDGPTVRFDSLSSPVADATTVEAAIERAHERIDALARRPLEAADSHRHQPPEEDRHETVERLETTFDRYRELLETVWNDEEMFGIERGRLQERVEETAAELIETRREIAADAVDRAERALAAGRRLAAGDDYRLAARHYERAHSLAKTYRAGDPGPIHDALASVREARTQLPLRPTLREE